MLPKQELILDKQASKDTESLKWSDDILIMPCIREKITVIRNIFIVEKILEGRLNGKKPWLYLIEVKVRDGTELHNEDIGIYTGNKERQLSYLPPIEIQRNEQEQAEGQQEQAEGQQDRYFRRQYCNSLQNYQALIRVSQRILELLDNGNIEIKITFRLVDSD